MVVTHQHSGDPTICIESSLTLHNAVVTHQHSGDPTIKIKNERLENEVVTHQHSGDPTIDELVNVYKNICRNSPTFW